MCLSSSSRNATLPLDSGSQDGSEVQTLRERMCQYVPGSACGRVEILSAPPNIRDSIVHILRSSNLVRSAIGKGSPPDCLPLFLHAALQEEVSPANLMKRRSPGISLVRLINRVPANFVVFVIVVVVALALYTARRFRSRCPHRDPLCRASKPCILCYRDLYKNNMAVRGRE